MSPDSHPSHRQNFYLGLVTGATLGAGLAYLSKHHQSANLKKHLLQKAKQFSHRLPAIIDRLAKNIEPQNQSSNTLKQELQEITTIFTSDPNQKPDSSKLKTKPNLKTKIANSIKVTTQKAQKIFFTRSGKKLTK